MGSWHIDQACESALIHLNDELCSLERNTGREYTLFLIPESLNEPIHISQSGKPLPPDFLHHAGVTVEELLAQAMARRVYSRPSWCSETENHRHRWIKVPPRPLTTEENLDV